MMGLAGGAGVLGVGVFFVCFLFFWPVGFVVFFFFASTQREMTATCCWLHVREAAKAGGLVKWTAKQTEGMGGIKLSNSCNVGMLRSNKKDPVCFYSQSVHYTPA